MEAKKQFDLLKIQEIVNYLAIWENKFTICNHKNIKINAVFVWLFEYNSYLCKSNDGYSNEEYYFKDMKFYDREKEKRVLDKMLMQSKQA